MSKLLRAIVAVIALSALSACYPVYPPNTWPWDPLAQCESTGRWSIHNPPYEGGVQFTHSTWVAYGGRRFAEHAYLADRNQQITIAINVLHGQGPGAWPHCSYVVGMR